ncbi:CMP-N,N'-diacetyllegionaminic acid synthase [Eubacterium plexicaudatum ASF492]|uniref:Pseudaminic acid CMP-transferase n=1 Tax=Eubacterium plexicaudatum ASF492 TaxID=1235802 RepID=N2BJW7_9FIRM|nr:CMP-N,N'-diacetyllegionaminic acid synthase [Eubacterium plexicaudatum ASF492]
MCERFMKRIAIITARGGSKRIPLKNIKVFCGKPVIVYSIASACKSSIFDTVMVSTDSRQIADIAKAAGAEVPFLRSSKNADDYATTDDVLIEVLHNYAKAGKCYEQACCIYPTAPFVTAQRLRYGMECLTETGADTVMSVVKYAFPPQRGMWIRSGRASPIFPHLFQHRSQDLEPVYHDAGQFYCFDVNRFLASGSLIGDYVYPLILNELEVQDIDSPSDWELAQIKYEMLRKKNREQM